MGSYCFNSHFCEWSWTVLAISFSVFCLFSQVIQLYLSLVSELFTFNKIILWFYVADYLSIICSWSFNIVFIVYGIFNHINLTFYMLIFQPLQYIVSFMKVRTASYSSLYSPSYLAVHPIIGASKLIIESQN